MPKREGEKLDQLNQEEFLEGGQEVATGTFQKASEDVLQKRRIVRVRRSTATTTPATNTAAPSHNPFANIKIPVKPVALNASTKKEDDSNDKTNEDGAEQDPAVGTTMDSINKPKEEAKEETKKNEEQADEANDGKSEEKKDESLKRQKTESVTSFADFKPAADSKQASFGQSSGFGGFSFAANTSGLGFGNATSFGVISKAPGTNGFGEGSASTFTATAATTKTETTALPNILPETFDVQTGEEDEDCLTGPLKCKIFKAMPSTKSTAETVTAAGVPPSKSNDDEEKEESKKEEETFVWKYFGIGEVKILQHKETKNVRIVQRNGPTVVLNERLKDSVKMTLLGENELRLNFLDSCNFVALKVNKAIFSSFVDAIRPHVSLLD